MLNRSQEQAKRFGFSLRTAIKNYRRGAPQKIETLLARVDRADNTSDLLEFVKEGIHVLNKHHRSPTLEDFIDDLTIGDIDLDKMKTLISAGLAGCISESGPARA